MCLMTKRDYRFKHFTSRLLLTDLKFSKSNLKLGDRLPDLKFQTIDGRIVTQKELYWRETVATIAAAHRLIHVPHDR